MKAHVNSLLSRVPVKFSSVVPRRPWFLGRSLHSDAVTSAAAVAKAAPQQETPPLVDLIGRQHNYLRISLTERCNLRCQYCMPEEGVTLSKRSALLSRSELVRVTRRFAALGVTKLRLTGGEPTLRADLADIIQELSSIPGIRWLGMTTNGLVLTRRLVSYQRAGLTAINVSLDSLRPQRYEKMARRPGLQKVLAGIDLALQLGYRPVKINVVLMKGFNDDEIGDFVEYTRDRAVEVRFIEFMPFSGNKWDDSKLIPHRAAVRTLTDKYPNAAPALPRPHDTARVWKVPGYEGSVGFISSMTNNFCATCNRLRLTADGNLKVCLFGNAEVSLRDAVRSGASDEQLDDMIRTALRNKKPQHAAPPPASLATSARQLTSLLSTSLLSSTTSLLTPSTLAASQLRAYSTDNPTFTHLDEKGRARMVDVGDKAVTSRSARAVCSLRVGGRVLRAMRDAKLPKGDALTVAQLAGVLGAKKTSDLIPLCHPLPLDCVRVTIDLPHGECAGGGEIQIQCEVKVTARTGAEMEALTGACISALALYDMCKAVDKTMRFTDLRVLHKTGGRNGEWPKSSDVKVREYDRSPIKPDETFVPTNFV